MKINQELINKLKNGYIAIDNTGNPNVELLRVVLKEAFPINYTNTNGIYKYYFRHQLSVNSRSSSDYFTNNLPTIPLKDFLEEFVLPKDFWVRVKNLEEWCVFSKYAKEKFKRFNFHSTFTPYEYPYYFGLENYLQDFTYNNRKIIFQNEITLDQFKQYVLKNLENNMENKEIIGYKLKDEKYLEAAKIIGRQTCFAYSEGIRNKTNEFAPNSGHYDLFKKEGVLDLWFEPVFKNKEVVIKMAETFNITVKDGKAYHETEDISNYVAGVHAWYLASKALQTKKIANYDFIVKDITLSKTGCKATESSISSWLLVYDELMKQK